MIIFNFRSITVHSTKEVENMEYQEHVCTNLCKTSYILDVDELVSQTKSILSETDCLVTHTWPTTFDGKGISAFACSFNNKGKRTLAVTFRGTYAWGEWAMYPISLFQQVKVRDGLHVCSPWAITLDKVGIFHVLVFESLLDKMLKTAAHPI